jgi:general secretion pathway protein H
MRGFTLVEMLVVLAIIGLMVAIVPPMMRSRESGDLRAIAHATAADLRLLRAEAIRRDMTTAFMPLATGYALQPSGRTRSLPAGVALDFAASPSRLLPDGSGAIDFFPDGSSTGGVLSVSWNGSVARVLIRGVDGRVRLYE